MKIERSKDDKRDTDAVTLVMGASTVMEWILARDSLRRGYPCATPPKMEYPIHTQSNLYVNHIQSLSTYSC